MVGAQRIAQGCGRDRPQRQQQQQGGRRRNIEIHRFLLKSSFDGSYKLGCCGMGVSFDYACPAHLVPEDLGFEGPWQRLAKLSLGKRGESPVEAELSAMELAVCCMLALAEVPEERWEPAVLTSALSSAPSVVRLPAEDDRFST